MNTKKSFKKSQNNAISHTIKYNSFSKLAEKCKEYVRCDTIRISKPLEDGKMFLIIGFNRNTTKDEGQWVNQDNEQIDFDYYHLPHIKEKLNESKELKNIFKTLVRKEILTNLLKDDINEKE
jgi:hypothetical protein